MRFVLDADTGASWDHERGRLGVFGATRARKEVLVSNVIRQAVNDGVPVYAVYGRGREWFLPGNPLVRSYPESEGFGELEIPKGALVIQDNTVEPVCGVNLVLSDHVPVSTNGYAAIAVYNSGGLEPRALGCKEEDRGQYLFIDESGRRTFPVPNPPPLPNT